MIRVFKSVAAKLWLLAILLVILAGILVGSARVLFPMASELREYVEDIASAEAGVPVKIGHLDARLAGLSPQLVLKQVQLFDQESGAPVLRLGEVHLGVDFMASIRARELRISKTILVGALLSLKRHMDGRLEVVGLIESKDRAGGEGLANVFLADGHLQLKESSILWTNEQSGASPMFLEKVNVDILNVGQRHQIDMRAQLASSQGTAVRFIADLHGQPASPQAWVGEIYLKGEHLPVDEFLVDQLPPAYEVEAGLLDVELWSFWRVGKLDRVQGHLQFSDAQLVKEIDGQDLAERIEIELIKTDFDGVQSAEGWDLSLSDFTLWQQESHWPPGQIDIKVSAANEGEHHIEVGADFLRLQDVLGWLPMLPGDKVVLPSMLDELQLQAEVSDVRFSLKLAPDQSPDWRVTGQVKNWHNQYWKAVPAVKRLDFSFQADAHQGWVDFATHDAALRFKSLFRYEMQMGVLQGRLNWQLDDDKSVVLRSDLLQLENDDLKTKTRLSLIIPGDGSSPIADIQTDFWDGDGSTTGKYLPVGIMKLPLISWLDNAVVSGRLAAGSFLLHGPLKSFPFIKGEGNFEVIFGVENVILNYREQWPRLEELSAELQFINNRMEIVSEGGKLLDSNIDALRVWIPQFKPLVPLQIKGRVTGPFTDAMSILSDTPLSDKFGALVKKTQVAGESQVRVDLRIPFKKQHGPVRTRGNIRWSQAALDMRDWNLTLSNLKGLLAFSEEGVEANGVQADLLGAPVTLDVSNLQTGTIPRTQIKARLAPTTERLRKQYPGAGFEQLSGDTQWDLVLDIDHAQPASVSMQLSSDLRGAEVSLPAPLGKSANEVRKLWVSGQLAGADLSRFDVKYGDLARAALMIDMASTGDNRFRRGELRFGGGAAKMPSQPGLTILGDLQQMDLTPWLGWLFTGGQGQSDFLQHLDMRVKSVSVDGSEWTNVHAKVKPRGKAGWMVEVESDQLEGSIVIPADMQRSVLEVNLAYLKLALPEEEESTSRSAETVSALDGVDPRQFPAFALKVNSLLLNDVDFGQVNVAASKNPAGLLLKELELQSPLLTLSGKGSWLMVNGEKMTRLEMAGKSNNLGDLLRKLGYSSAVDAAPLTISTQLAWPGGPQSASWGEVDGLLSVKLGQGRLLELEPGVGRVFGLLSFGALRRRLTLDFSDLFKKGYAFDEIKADFKLKDGDAYTDNLRIEGPSARISIEGRTGLVSKDYDQYVAIVPRVSSGIPVVGALTAGPAVGAVLLIVQQLLGKEVDKISRFRYHVSGDWDDPVFAPIEVSRPPAPEEDLLGH